MLSRKLDDLIGQKICDILSLSDRLIFRKVLISDAEKFFVVLTCHYPVLDEFDWLFQASVHCFK